MQIRFTKIKLHNFMSFDDAELDLTDMGYTLVEGRNYCKLDSAYSNGSGKSSIFNGICFALTGETAQGVSNGVENIFANPDDCWVQLTFSVDNDEFILKRFKTPRPDMKIWVNGEDKSGKGIRESSKLLATYLPDLTSTLVNSIIILGQGLPNRFTNNNPAQRKEILEKLTKSDFMIQSIKDKLDIRQSELRSDLRKKEDDLLSNTSKLQVYNDQLTGFEAEKKNYDEYMNSEYGLEHQIAQLNEEISSIETELAQQKVEYDSVSNTIDKLEAENTVIRNDSSTKIDAAVKDIDNELLQENSELNDLSADIKVLSKEIKKLDAITDICPTCGQKIPNVNRPDTTDKKLKLNKLEEEYELKKKVYENNRLKRSEIVNDIETLTTESIKVNNTKITDLKTRLKDLLQEQTQFANKKVNLTGELNKLINLSNNYQQLMERIKVTSEAIDILTKDSNGINLDIISINGHLDVVQQMITLAKREFRGILLLNIIEYINKKVKQYSVEVFSTEELEFTLDENAIDISYCGKPYENLSGGEKQKIDIIVQLALRDVLSKQLNIHSNLLVLDEIFDNLDLQGCSKIMNLISGLTDIDSIFIISHHAQDLELTKDNGIVVEKNEEGISSIKIV